MDATSLTRTTMKERPIIFSSESVRAILAGRKTQTRRVIKSPDGPGDKLCPHGAPGSHLWVRETWGAVWPEEWPVPLEKCIVEYRADLPLGCTDYPGHWPAEIARGDPDAPKWRSPIHMPRSASRILLGITDVRAERLQQITRLDCACEGWPCSGEDEIDLALAPILGDDAIINDEAIEWFARHWDALNAKRGYGWNVNPWVWVIEFKMQDERSDMTRCGYCHTCSTKLLRVLDGEEWCPTCQTYRRYASHGWAGGIGASTCPDLRVMPCGHGWGHETILATGELGCDLCGSKNDG